MKNLMIFVSPTGDFGHGEWGRETTVLAKVQIDNSLEMGWEREDIVLATNFGYEYRGVKSLVLEGGVYCRFSPTANKIYAILELMRRGIVGDGLWWFHDFDAFQLEELREEELGVAPDEIGLTDYGRSSINSGRDLRWSTGSLFFSRGSEDLFDLWRGEIEKYRTNEEIALLEMLKKGKFREARRRVRKLNITYNLATRKRKVMETYDMAEKPLKVIHFHPFDDRAVEGPFDNMDVCVRGVNSRNIPLVTERFKKVLEKHGIE